MSGGCLRARLRIPVFAVTAAGLTFSFTIIGAVVPGHVRHALNVTTAVWAATMLAGYTLYHTALRRRPLRPLWLPARGHRALLAVTAVTLTLIGLAISMPPQGRTSLDLVQITVAGVVGEESVFRGLIWEIADDTLRPGAALWRDPTLWLTTALFSLGHLQYNGFQLTTSLAGQFGYTAVAGLVLGAARRRTGTIVWPMLLHASGNSLLKLLPLALH